MVYFPSAALLPAPGMLGTVRGRAERSGNRVKHTHGRAAHPILRKEIAHDFCLPDFPRIVFPIRKERAEVRLTSQMAEQLGRCPTRLSVCVWGAAVPTAHRPRPPPPASPPPGTHDGREVACSGSSP